VKLITRYSPVAIHFGSLESRLLQLAGGPGGWKVHAHASAGAQGSLRHASAVEHLLQALSHKKLRGKDALIATSGEASAVNLVPMDPAQRSRLQQTLQETAARAINDPEGISYRYLPLAGGAVDHAQREEFLLLTSGQSESRRCTEAAESMQLRAVGLEYSAFPTARALHAMHGPSEDPWGFLQLGMDRSLFGIVHEGEMRFLKPMQSNGQSLLQTVTAALPELPNEEAMQHPTVATLQQNAVGHAVEILHALRLESEGMAQEIRACLRHFSARHKGARLASVTLTGFGAALPEVENALDHALSIPTSVARPFSELGIQAPAEILAEEHLWCTPLGLALRGES